MVSAWLFRMTRNCVNIIPLVRLSSLSREVDDGGSPEEGITVVAGKELAAPEETAVTKIRIDGKKKLDPPRPLRPRHKVDPARSGSFRFYDETHFPLYYTLLPFLLLFLPGLSLFPFCFILPGHRGGNTHLENKKKKKKKKRKRKKSVNAGQLLVTTRVDRDFESWRPTVVKFQTESGTNRLEFRSRGSNEKHVRDTQMKNIFKPCAESFSDWRRNVKKNRRRCSHARRTAEISQLRN